MTWFLAHFFEIIRKILECANLCVVGAGTCITFIAMLNKKYDDAATIFYIFATSLSLSILLIIFRKRHH